MALDATVGGASSDSYISVANADTYFGTDSRLRATAWTGETTAQKEAALKMATRRLDREKYQGLKVDSGQALKWPRQWAIDDDGEEYATDAIPGIITDATCELALQYLIDDDDGEVPQLDTGLEEFDEAEIGPMRVKRRKSYRADQLPAHIKGMLRTVLETPGRSVRLMRA